MNKIYNDLMEQYNALSDSEKHAIATYKTNLYAIINDIGPYVELESKDILTLTKLNDKCTSFINIYNEIKNLSSNKEAFEYALKDISFDSVLSLIDSLKRVYLLLLSAKDKIVCKNPLTLYRGISSDDKMIDNISKSNIVSTSLNIDVTDQFLWKRKYNHFLIINIPAGTHLLIAPKSVLAVYDSIDSKLGYRINGFASKKIKITDENRQEEVLLFRDDMNIISEEIKAIGPNIYKHEIYLENKKRLKK